MSIEEFDLQQFEEFRKLESEVLDLRAENEKLKKENSLLKNKTQTVSGSYQFLANPEEDIYTDKDGQALKGETDD